MLITPTLKSKIKPFNAGEDYNFIFYVDGSSDQVVRNNLIIENIKDNTVVYDSTQESFTFSHKVPANSLQNGINYKVKLRIGNIKNEWSQYSGYEIFWCFSPPTINIINIDYENQNRVYNQTVDFKSTYNQTENEPLKSYRYLLYDSNKDLVKTFPEKFYNSEEYLTQEIAGLENDELKYLEVKTLSINNNEGSSGLIWFKPFYVAPRLTSVLTSENLPDQGAIKLSANIIQIIGKLYDSKGKQINPIKIEYIDNEWLDLTRPDYYKLVFDDGFNIMQSDFMLKKWFKNLKDGVPFIFLYSPYGHIEFIRFGTKIHIYKRSKMHKIVSHFASPDVDFIKDKEYMLYAKHTKNRFDMNIVPL